MIILLVGLSNFILSNEQITILCEETENAVRKHVLSKIPKKQIRDLDILIEADGLTHVNVSVEVTIILSSNSTDLDVNKLTTDAINHGFNFIDQFLENLDANSTNT
jgi:hypothetical protein